MSSELEQQHAPLVSRADHDGIAELTLSSPHNRNALSRQLVGQLREHLQAASHDPSVNALVLRSSHRVFCAGADLAEAAHVDMVQVARSLIDLQRLIASAPVPVVVRLDGPVRAGGLGLVAAADVVLAASDVTFALTEVKLGLAPAVISPALSFRLGTRVAALYFLTGRTFSATKARDCGLVTAVADADDLDDAVEDVLEDLRAASRQGLVETKKLLMSPLIAEFDAKGEQLATLSGALFHSPEAQRAMAAVLK